MITVITGTPGAGKTLHAIDKLLRPLVGQTIEHEIDGVKVQIPRTIYTNINGLLLDHQLIDGGENLGLRDWYKWAKPGSVICFDEVQRVWGPRPNGSKVPEDVQALETHRHMGVDFILVTQNVVQLDRNISALGGRHLHVRRIANMRLAIVYEWDHISRTLMYSKAMTKAPWRYDKSVFKLYKSAELHTKQPRKMPGLVWFIGLAFCGIAYFAPNVYSRIQSRIQNGGVPQEVVDARKKEMKSLSNAAPGQYIPASSILSGVPIAPSPSIPASGVIAAPKFGGCVAMRGVCRCYMDDSTPFEKSADFCQEKTGANLPQKTVKIPDSLQEYLPEIKPDKSKEYATFAPEKAKKTTFISLADVSAMYRK